MMPFDAATVQHRLAFRIEFTPPVLQSPVFASNAAWLGVLGQAIARSGCVPGEDTQPLVLIRLLTPAADGGGFAQAAETIDDGLVDTVVGILAEHGWQATAAGVIIREEADERTAPLLDVALYVSD